MKIQIGPHTTKPGQVRRALGFEIWSEDGVVFLVSQKHGEVTTFTQKTAKERRDAFAEEAEKVWDKAKDSGNLDDKAYAREQYAAIKQLVEVLSETINDARFQGDPDNEEVRQRKLAQFLREKCAGKGNRSFQDNVFQVPPSRLVFPTGYSGG